MKHRLNTLLAIVSLLVISGCSYIQQMTVSEEATFDFTLSITAKHLAIEIVKEYPNEVSTFSDIVDQTLLALEGDGNPVDNAINSLVTYLIERCNDPVLKSDLNDLFDMLELRQDGRVIRVKLDTEDLNTIIDKGIIALKGMQEGIKIAQEQ